MSFPDLIVQFSPTTGPFDTPTWITLSEGGPHGNRVLSAEWTDGKQADLSEFPAGEATIVLRNDDRLFDPEHASGTYFGDLNPRVPFRIRATHSAVTYDLFYGFVEDGWEQDYQPPEGSVCVVKLVDLLGVLSGYTLPGVFDAAILALDPVAYWPLGEGVGSQSVADLAGANDGSAVGDPTFGRPSLAAGLGTSVEFDGVNDRIDISRSPLWDGSSAWALVAVIQTDTPAEVSSAHPIFMQRDGNDAADMAAVVIDTAGKVVRYQLNNGAGFVYINDTVVTDGETHLVIGSRDPVGTDYGVAVDSAVLSQTTTTNFGQSGNGVAIGGTAGAAPGYTDNQFEGLISSVAAFDVALTLTQRQSIVDAFPSLVESRSDEQIQWILDQIGVPAGMIDLDVGRSIMGALESSGRDGLELMREITATEQGDLFVNHADGGKLKFRQRYASFQDTRSTVAQIAFSDDPAASWTTTAKVEPGTLEIEPNGVQTIINQATVSWRDGEETVTVASAYGPRPVTIETQAPTPAMARGIGQWITSLNAVPQARVRSLGINPAAVQGIFPLALGTQIGDRATYRSKPQDVGSATTKQLEVLGRHHTVQGRSWDVDFYLTAAVADGVDLFTLGTSELGGTHVLAY